MKVIKKPTKPGKASAGKTTCPKDWRDAIRLQLAKVPEVDAIYACTENGTVHVYSVVYDFLEDSFYRPLQKQERLIEKAFPRVSFEFHTWAHQGRKPSESGPLFSELVYLR